MVRTPRTIYKDGFTMEFFTKQNEIYYKFSKWVDDGLIQILIESGKLGERIPKEIFDSALQKFGDVIRQ